MKILIALFMLHTGAPYRHCACPECPAVVRSGRYCLDCEECEEVSLMAGYPWPCLKEN